MYRKISLAAAGVACLSASPAAAADPSPFFQDQQRASVGGYVGITLSLVKSGRTDSAPHLRLGMGARRSGETGSRDLAGASRNAVELDLTAKGKPNLYLGGRRLSAAEGGSGWGTGETLLVIAGVAAAILLATQLGGSDDDDDERCMIEPELCD